MKMCIHVTIFKKKIVIKNFNLFESSIGLYYNMPIIIFHLVLQINNKNNNI